MKNTLGTILGLIIVGAGLAGMKHGATYVMNALTTTETERTIQTVLTPCDNAVEVEYEFGTKATFCPNRVDHDALAELRAEAQAEAQAAYNAQFN